MPEATISEEAALDTLMEVKFKHGRNYKSKIRGAWMNGNYETDSLEEWSRELQQIRNAFGPSWLVAANPKIKP
jgi:hypothetical protein